MAGDVEGRTNRRALTERARLGAERRPLAERAAVRLLADERDARRPQLARDALEPRPDASAKSAGAQVARAGRRPQGGVGDADPEPEELALLGRRELARRQPRRVEQPPEVVARVREVRGRGRRGAARVDPHEHEPQVRREDVGDGGLRLVHRVRAYRAPRAGPSAPPVRAIRPALRSAACRMS